MIIAKIHILPHKFQIIQKFQLPNFVSLIYHIRYLFSKHLHINIQTILNIFQRHNLIQNFASIGRVDLVLNVKSYSLFRCINISNV